MVLVLEVPVAAIALVLSLLSWKTLRAIKHLDVGKSFWIPVLLSGTFFLAGSFVAILNDLGLSFTIYTIEMIAVIKLLALCTLVSGVYTYSAKIVKNLGETFTLPTSTLTVTSDSEKVEVAEPSLERMSNKTPANNVECKHKFGYLQTLPRGTPIPDDCLNCHQIIECKHPYLGKTTSKQEVPSSEIVSDVMVSETGLKKRSC